jgi:hypothetical protein
VATCENPCFQKIRMNTDYSSLATVVMQLTSVESYADCITCDDRSSFTRTSLYAFIPDISVRPWDWRLSLRITSGKDLHSVSLKREFFRVKSMEQLVYHFIILDSSTKAFHFVRPDQRRGTFILNRLSPYRKSDTGWFFLY